MQNSMYVYNIVCIDQVHYTEFLSITINNKLEWSEHVAYITPKDSKSINTINKVKGIVTKTTCSCTCL